MWSCRVLVVCGRWLGRLGMCRVSLLFGLDLGRSGFDSLCWLWSFISAFGHRVEGSILLFSFRRVYETSL
jgi:hypothetical protein